MIISALISVVGIIQCSTIMTAVDCRQSTKTGPKMFSLHKSVQPGRFLIKNVWKFIFWSKDLVKNNWKYRIFFTLQNDFLAITSFPHTSVKIIILLLNRYRSRAKYKAIKLFTEVWGKKLWPKNRFSAIFDFFLVEIKNYGHNILLSIKSYVHSQNFIKMGGGQFFEWLLYL